MSDFDALDERLRAVERALTDDDTDLTDLRDAAELAREVERLAARLDDAEETLADLDAATQALRGYVGNVRAVNQSVERRADAALAKAETVETELEGVEPSATDRSETESRSVAASRSVTASRSVPASRPTRACNCNCDSRRVSSESDRDESGLLARIAAAVS